MQSGSFGKENTFAGIYCSADIFRIFRLLETDAVLACHSFVVSSTRAVQAVLFHTVVIIIALIGKCSVSFNRR